jgi:hypothetical protein
VDLLGVHGMKFEIREHGVILDAVAFWPWNRIRMYRWKDGEIPVLVLQLAKYGFRSIDVAPEQKSAIDEYLREHVENLGNAPPPGTAPPGQPSIDT